MSAMDSIVIRRGKHEDDQDFAELALFTGPELFPALFGPNVKNVWRKAFHHRRTCFSFEHTLFIEADGEIAGMALTYSYEAKKKEELRSLIPILRYLKWDFFKQVWYLYKAGGILVQIAEGDHYLSNIAVYPRFRGLGYGAKLIEVIEEEARTAGSRRMVIELETDNEKAVKLYERLGYKIELKSPVLKIRRQDFEFFKMAKDL